MIRVVKHDKPHSTPSNTGVLPEFIRIPRVGQRCPHSGLTRNPMLALVTPNASNGNRPPVRGVLLRKPGAMRGIRLVHLPSLLAYLNEEADKQTPAA